MMLRTGRVRVSTERFELSFWDPGPLVYGGAAWFSWLYIAGPRLQTAVWVTVAFLVASAHSRAAFVVTARGSWVVRRMFGIPWLRLATGSHPRINTLGGWDFNEIEIVRADGRLRDGTVLAEWDDNNERANQDGILLARLAEQHVLRLHG